MSIVVEVAGVEIIRCMCGDLVCPYCKEKMSPHCGAYCPRCGFPLKSKCLNKDAQKLA